MAKRRKANDQSQANLPGYDRDPKELLAAWTAFRDPDAPIETKAGPDGRPMTVLGGHAGFYCPGKGLEPPCPGRLRFLQGAPLSSDVLHLWCDACHRTSWIFNDHLASFAPEPAAAGEAPQEETPDDTPEAA